VIGLPEIVVFVVVILLVVGYRKLPAIGRSAGAGLRSGIDGARGLSSKVGDKVEAKVDPSSIGRSAGRSVREVREVRDVFTGKEPPKDGGSGAGSDDG
jgi:sec-independent protein translocase protein TatA